MPPLVSAPLPSKQLSGWTPPPPSFHSPQRIIRTLAPATPTPPPRSKFSWSSASAATPDRLADLDAFTASAWSSPLASPRQRTRPAEEASFRGWSFDAPRSLTPEGISPGRDAAISPKTQVPPPSTHRNPIGSPLSAAPTSRSVFVDSDSETEELAAPHESPLAKLRAARGFFRSPTGSAAASPSARRTSRLRTTSEDGCRPEVRLDSPLGARFGISGHARGGSSGSSFYSTSSAVESSYYHGLRGTKPATPPLPTVPRPDVRMTGQAVGALGLGAPISLDSEGRRQFSGAQVVRRPADAFSSRGGPAYNMAPSPPSRASAPQPIYSSSVAVAVSPRNANAGPFSDLLDAPEEVRQMQQASSAAPPHKPHPFAARATVGVEAPRRPQLPAPLRLAFDPRRRPRAHLNATTSTASMATTEPPKAASPVLSRCPSRMMPLHRRLMPSAATKSSPPSRPRRPSEADKLAQANKVGPALRRPMRGPLPPLPAVKPQPTVPLPSLPSPEHSPSAEAADAPLLGRPHELQRKPSKTRAMLQALSTRNRSHQRLEEPQEELEASPPPPPPMRSFTPAHTPSASRELKPLLLAIHAGPSGASKVSALKASASHLAPPTLRARRFSRNTAGSYGSLSSRYDKDASQNNASSGLSSSEDSGDESEASLSLASQNFHAANPFNLSPLIIEDSSLEPGSPLPIIDTDDSLVHRVSGGNLLRGSKDALLFDVASPTSPRPAGTPARAGFLASLSPDHRAHYLAMHAAAGAGRTHRHAPSSVSETSCASSFLHHREDSADEDASTHSRASTPELVASHRPSVHLTTPTPATVAKGFGAAQAEHQSAREFDEALSRWARAVQPAACP